MPTIVTRLYADAATAAAAAADLAAKGFRASEVSVFSGKDVTAQAIGKAGVYAAAAATYAERVKAGAALAVVDASTGNVFRAVKALEARGPIPAAVASTETYYPSKEPRSRYADNKHLPTLLNPGTFFFDNLFRSIIRGTWTPNLLTSWNLRSGLLTGKLFTPNLLIKR